ncbi:MAG: retropepsin-like aspartic protease [bacterium]
MIEIKIDEKAPLIILTVVVNSKIGKRRIGMVVDTGATYTIIPWDIAEALGYKPELSQEKITIITASGIEIAPLIKIDKIEVLGKEIKDVWVVCHDLPPQSGVKGLLGIDSLRRLKIQIDFNKNLLKVL